MDLELHGKGFVVTGSSRGIGKAIAAGLLHEGARVALCGRDKRSLADTAAELESLADRRVVSVCGDLTKPETLETLTQLTTSEWGRVDGVVANAGAVRPIGPAGDSDADCWEWFYNANFLVTTGVIEVFKADLEASHGSVVIVGSIAGLEDLCAPLQYSSTKAALTMYMKGLSRQVAANGVRVNMVAPGNIHFPGGNWDRKLKSDRVAVQRMLDDAVPLRRFGRPEEIADTVAFLLSRRSAFTTGACFVVDGGQTSRV